MYRLLVLASLVAGCGESLGTGRAQVFAVAEDTISGGLVPGSAGENIKDGWTVKYDRFLMAIGNFRARRSAAPAERLVEPRVYVLDLKALPSEGFVMAQFDQAVSARWDKVGFDLPNASASALRAPATTPADYDLMVQGGYSLFIAATLTKSDGKSCLPKAPTDCVERKELKVSWGLKAGTSFDDCAPEMGDAGFAVPAGGTVQVKPTIHGDHWFFNNLTQGAEITERLAQWIVDCDLDRNGQTTLDELGMVKAADVFAAPKYNLTGALIPIETARDFLEAQARTIGDFQGEGECPTRRVL
ncbi:MAG: hypothetical protein EXR72_24375 [Myxococcales bacterium]|nr:hypothetical protein [Myxococcales bacterium]